MTAGDMDQQYAQAALSEISALNVQTLLLHLGALAWAAQLSQANAYDAYYLALADSLHLALWTADRRLANRSAQIGIRWVHCIME